MVLEMNFEERDYNVDFPRAHFTYTQINWTTEYKLHKVLKMVQIELGECN